MPKRARQGGGFGIYASPLVIIEITWLTSLLLKFGHLYLFLQSIKTICNIKDAVGSRRNWKTWLGCSCKPLEFFSVLTSDSDIWTKPMTDSCKSFSSDIFLKIILFLLSYTSLQCFLAFSTVILWTFFIKVL